MNPEQRQYLLDLARRSIRAQLQGERLDPPAPGSPDLQQPCGVFVTLKLQGRLRGCIGNIQSGDPLYKTVKSMAAAAATQDPRFPPLDATDLERAHIEISVLTPLEKVDAPDQIQVGVHGLFIKKEFYSGLLLPQVPVEWRWDRDTFLQQTCRKAGLPPDAWMDPKTEIFRFSAEVFGEEE